MGASERTLHHPHRVHGHPFQRRYLLHRSSGLEPERDTRVLLQALARGHAKLGTTRLTDETHNLLRHALHGSPALVHHDTAHSPDRFPARPMLPLDFSG